MELDELDTQEVFGECGECGGSGDHQSFKNLIRPEHDRMPCAWCDGEGEQII